MSTAESPTVSDRRDDIEALVALEHPEPHRLLGAHAERGATVVRVWRPDATGVRVLPDDGPPVEAARLHDAGLFEAELPHEAGAAPRYRLEVGAADGRVRTVEDPYRFWPTLGDLDLHLVGEGRHEQLWEVLGARVLTHDGVDGTAFSVWAPAARSVRLVGDFNGWDGRHHPMRALGASGVWELFVPEVGSGALYKFEILTQDRHIRLKADPMARSQELAPGTASRVYRSRHEWHDGEWMEQRRARGPLEGRMSVYEVHLGSWRRVPEEGGRSLGYRELAEQLADHVVDLGFTHVELMPVAEYPFEGSWGYQVSNYYAPTGRFGEPDDFRAFVDHLHQRGIGVLVDWVPAHFPRDDWALARFDGSSLYEHADPRQGEHPDWGTMIFNFGRNEVRNFLVANALYWLEEFHVDGLRVDAVASMLYLDYSREEGDWVPNRYGGNENLEAIEFVREFNSVVHRRYPGVATVAEESTAWGGVSRPVHLGGLGFTHKWNMGWMHDTLDYLSHHPVYRRYHHHELTFGLIYAWSENFVLPLSHDEVVHGKGSLVRKMPGDDWQRLANLRALYAWMWAHPGRQLLFMGAEMAQEREWSHERSLDWHLLDEGPRRGICELVRELNRVQAEHPALWEADFDASGFAWIDANDADQSCYSFARYRPDGRSPVVCVANFTPVPRHGYRVGLPAPGLWEQVLNTDQERWGGSGVDNPRELGADALSWHGHEHSAVLSLPPLGVVLLAHRG